MLRKIFLILGLAALLMACGGGEEEAAAPAPAEPAAEGGEEAAEETGADAVQALPESPEAAVALTPFTSDAIGLTIGVPDGWPTEDADGAVLIASSSELIGGDSPDVNEGALITATSFDAEFVGIMTDGEADAEDPVEVLGVFSGLFLSDEEVFEQSGEPTATTIGGNPAATMGITGEDNGQQIEGQMITILEGERVLFIFAVLAVDSQDEFQPIVDEMLASIVLSAPAAAEEMADSSAEEMVEEEPAEEMAEEEMAEEPASDAAVVIPALAPATVSLESGDYIYSNGNRTRDVALYNGQLWAPSTGGLGVYDLATGESRKYTTLNGLPNIGTFSVEVCPINGEERLLLGTRVGLYLYDDANDAWVSGDLIGFGEETSVSDMACDAANNRLVIGYDDITIIDLTTNTRTSYTEEQGLAWFTFDRFVPIGTDIWAATGYSGASVIAADGTITTYSEETGNLLDDDITDIAQAPDGSFWIGSSDALFQLQNGTFTAFDRDNSPAISFFGPDQVEFAPDGSLWVAFSSSICQFNTADGTCSQEFSNTDMGLSNEASIATFEVTANGEILISSFDHGVAYFDGAAWTGYTLPDQAPNNFIDGFYQASDETIWVAAEGVYRTNLEASSWERLEFISAEDMVEDENGDMWFLSSFNLVQFNGAQLVEYDDEENGILDSSHQAIAIDGEGMIYIGSREGYSIFDPSTGTAAAYGEEAGWAFGAIRDLYFANGRMYAATTEGLAALDGDSWEVLLDESFIDLPSKNIAVLAQWTDGALVLGTTAGIAYYTEDGSVRSDPVVTGSVSDIQVLPSGEIYAIAFNSGTFLGSGGNDDGGLYVYNGVDAWDLRAINDGFPMSSLRALLVDNAGTVWVGTGDTGLGGGILRIVP